MSFPPTYNLLAGTALSYPYLTDALRTTFYMLGMPPVSYTHLVNDHVRCIVIPGTQQVVKDCLKEGLVDICLLYTSRCV